jgi:hypothetical protein
MRGISHQTSASEKLFVFNIADLLRKPYLLHAKPSGHRDARTLRNAGLIDTRRSVALLFASRHTAVIDQATSGFDGSLGAWTSDNMIH